MPEMDWITVKIKAGKIVPALATTTAVVAALQTFEMLKVIQGLKPSLCSNSFLNLAVPSLYQSEPLEAEKFLLAPGFKVSIWDKWELTDVSPS